jgi:ankyrin repeat protein
MTPLMECTDVGLVRRLLELGVDVNARSRCGDTALLVACQRGNIEMASFLLTCGARTDAGGHWDILLRDACRAGRTKMVTLLLTFDNITLYHDTISLALQDPARVEILRLLLQRFPDCESPGRPLLHEAMKVGNLKAVRMLVEIRPPGYVDTRGLEGCTPLFNCYKPVVMRLLLELGADPRAADINGQTPITACRNPACVRLLLEAAPDLVCRRDDEGWNAVMHMSCSGDRYEALEELFRYCEEHGIDAGVNNKANNGDTALHIAMSTVNNPRVVKLLLEKGADALASGCDGMTVLMKPFRGPMPLPTGFQMPVERPAWTSVSLEAVLDAVLAQCAEATVEDPDAKRRRTNKQ